MGKGYRMVARASEAEIYIYEDVGESFFGGVSAKTFMQDLKDLGAVDTINVRINSYGGEVFDGLAMYRGLVDHKARVITHIDGVAASIASVIAMAGDEIRIAEAGFIMIHDASGLALGRAEDMRKMADTLETVTETICDVYEQRTQQDREAIRDWMREERWFTSADAVELLFADTIAQNLRVAAHSPIDERFHPFKNVPKALLSPAPVLLTEAPGSPPQVAARPTQQSPLAAKVALQAAQLAARRSSAT